MTYGFVAISDAGNLLASSESANYELSQRIVSGSRSGNVTTYNFSAVANPLVFVELPVGGTAGILQCTSSTVKIIGNGNYPIRVYKRITPPSGYGVAVYDQAGAPTFKASQSMLNAQFVGELPIGGAINSSAGAVSYSSAASYTTKSESTSGWQQVGLFAKYTSTNCVTYGGWRYDYVTGQQVWDASIVTYTTVSVQLNYSYQAKIKTTGWAVYRSAARNDGATKSFVWEAHSVGSYSQFVQTRLVFQNYQVLGCGGTYNTDMINAMIGPNSGVTPGVESAARAGYEVSTGAFTKDSQFPYSNGESRSTTATIMTSS